MELPPQRLVLEPEPAIAHQAVDLGQQLLEDHRLDQEVGRPAAEGGDGVLDRGEGGDHHHQGLGADSEQPIEQLDAVEARQLDVAERQVGLEPFDQRQRLRRVGGDGHLEPLALEELLEHRGDHVLVVDDQDATPTGRRSGRRGPGRDRLDQSAHVGLLARGWWSGLPPSSPRPSPTRRQDGEEGMTSPSPGARVGTKATASSSARDGPGRSAGSRTVNIAPRPGGDAARRSGCPPSPRRSAG